jgi:hypothetical protein
VSTFQRVRNSNSLTARRPRGLRGHYVVKNQALDKSDNKMQTQSRLRMKEITLPKQQAPCGLFTSQPQRLA